MTDRSNGGDGASGAALPDRRPPLLDLAKIKTIPLDDRPSLVETSAFSAPILPGPWFQTFMKTIPGIHAGIHFRNLVEAVASANERGAPVVLGMGAHVIKVGLAPLVNDLLTRGIVTSVALNGAGIIHDLEIALVGRSSEDVGAGLDDGSFGMSKETAEHVNGAASEAARRGIGLGQAIGERILELNAPHKDLSILATCARLGAPATVHVAVGADIVHMHGNADGAAIGEATMADFRLLAAVLAKMTGGAYLNFGSAVILPEVFMKALNLARNVGEEVLGFTTANLDQIRHYRPRMNVLVRPGGQSIEIVGHHEFTLPLLRLAVLDRLGIREDS